MFSATPSWDDNAVLSPQSYVPFQFGADAPAVTAPKVQPKAQPKTYTVSSFVAPMQESAFVGPMPESYFMGPSQSTPQPPIMPLPLWGFALVGGFALWYLMSQKREERP